MSKIEIKIASIIDLDVDCIVNAANSRLRAGGGVCGVIFRAAGHDKLQRACDQIGHCKTGNAVITPGFHLKQKYIIHAVGPQYTVGTKKEEKDLYNAYIKSLELAKENRFSSIGFPLISAGKFGYPKEEAWRIALSAVLAFLKKIENENHDIDVYFAVRDEETLKMGQEELIKQQGVPDELTPEDAIPETEETKDFVFFWLDGEKNGYLSQWYPAKMEIDGVEYANCEQYMMAKKALAMNDVESYILIMHETDPKTIKQLGRKVKNFDSAKWAACAPKVIYDGNTEKFRQNEELATRLIGTGDAILAEASPYDKIYGIGLYASDPNAKVVGNWKGKNLLGQTLMRVRKELQEDYAE